MTECIFCKILKGEIPSKKVYEDDSFIGILDLHPVSKGHTLIIPKKHYKTILDMPDSLSSEMLRVIKKIALSLIDKEKAEGFNLIVNNSKAAQQEVPHLHFHIIPRKKDDGLNLSFA